LSPAGPAGRCQQRGPHPAGLHRFR